MTSFNVLFLCTRNAARSIMAEALLNRMGEGRFHAFSAGSQPSGEVSPFALTLLEHEGFDIGFARSKSWDEFAGPDAPHMDFIFTLCDAAAAEECPVWPGHPATAHWGVPDPKVVAGNDAEKAVAFATTYAQLHRRIAAFLALPLATLEGLALQDHLHGIGKME